jgi:calcineurin-like phosphoesterase family protein
METVFFTADTHFSHPLVQRKRGFASIWEMNETLIERWNAVVSKGDRVYHLGDVSLGRLEETEAVLKRLNGQIYLVKGNHDCQIERFARYFVWIKDAHYLKVGAQKIYLHHYACRVWRSSHHGSWHLYGHSHGSLPDDPRAKSLDVGVDCWEFTPVSFDRIARRMEKKDWRPVDHHDAPDENDE